MSEDKEEKHPEVNVNKEGEVAAENYEEVECADERTDVVRPMDWEVKIPLCRDFVYQVALKNQYKARPEVTWGLINTLAMNTRPRSRTKG